MPNSNLPLWFPAIVTLASIACSADGAGVRRYEGPPVSARTAGGKGQVAITNRNGAIRVDTAGQTAEISAIGIPFAEESPDAAGERRATDAMAGLHLDVTSDAGGNVSVDGSGSESTGLDVTVHLPYPFSSLLSVKAMVGNVYFVGSSGGNGATIEVERGDVFVQDGGRTLTIKGGLTNIDVIALPTMIGTSLTTDVGDITAQIPDAANLLITATAESGGTVTPPPNKSVISDDGETQAFHASSSLHPLAVSNMGPGNKSATIQLGNPTKAGQQTLWVSTGHGNIVFR
jgi:hypothetical protein